MSRAQLYNRIHDGSLKPQMDGARIYLTRAELVTSTRAVTNERSAQAEFAGTTCTEHSRHCPSADAANPDTCFRVPRSTASQTAARRGARTKRPAIRAKFDLARGAPSGLQSACGHSCDLVVTTWTAWRSARRLDRRRRARSRGKRGSSMRSAVSPRVRCRASPCAVCPGEFTGHV
jgi:hypothetical protein